MQRVFAPEGLINGQILLDRDEAHHLMKVRRVEIGDPVQAFDGLGHAWLCRVAASTKTTALLDVQSVMDSSIGRYLPKLTIATAVPKGDRFDWIIEKATELGVDHLVPLRCERSVVEPRETKLDRLRKSVIESCKQCGRNDLMTLHQPMSLPSFLSNLKPGELGLVADQTGLPLMQIRSGIETLGHSAIKVCVGPEGGWTNQEKQSALAQGWQPVGLGPFILRIETAVVAAVAAIHSAHWNQQPKDESE